MLGFDLDIWDYITFVVVLIIAAGALAAACSLFTAGYGRREPSIQTVLMIGRSRRYPTARRAGLVSAR